MNNNNRDILRDYFNHIELDKVSNGFTLKVMDRIQIETQQTRETDPRLLKLTIFAIVLISLLPLIILFNVFDNEIISLFHSIIQRIALTLPTIDTNIIINGLKTAFVLSLILIIVFSKLITIGNRKSCVE